MSLDVLSTSDLVTGAPVLGPVAMSFDSRTQWPFRPNWNGGVDEEYEFNTDIFAGRTQREQRRALRATPRKRWEFQSLSYGEAYRAAIARVSSRFDSPFYLANPIHTVALALPFGQMDNVMTVASLPAWIVPDAVISIDSGEERRLYRVLIATGSDVTVAGVSGIDWPVGSRVRPTEIVYTDSFRIEAETASVARLRNTLAVDPTVDLFTGTSTPGPTFNGRELFLTTPNWRESVDLDLESGREAVDYGFGRTAYFSPVPFVLRTTKMTFLGRTQDETLSIVNFFIRMLGRCGEFYLPTHTADLAPITTLSGTTLRVDGTEFYSAFNSGDVNSVPILGALIVFLTDGTYLPRLISSVTRSGTNTLFNVSTAWPGSIALANIKKVSFLPVCRFANDKLTVSWESNHVANVVLNAKALEDL